MSAWSGLIAVAKDLLRWLNTAGADQANTLPKSSSDESVNQTESNQEVIMIMPFVQWWKNIMLHVT